MFFLFGWIKWKLSDKVKSEYPNSQSSLRVSCMCSFFPKGYFNFMFNLHVVIFTK